MPYSLEHGPERKSIKLDEKVGEKKTERAPKWRINRHFPEVSSHFEKGKESRGQSEIPKVFYRFLNVSLTR